jgi:hypothetical protein
MKICIFNQKLLKKLLSYAPLLFILPLIFVQCKLDNEDKIDYHGKLKYFDDQDGVKHFIENDENSGAYITLPECFTNEYSSVSITNKNNFVCSENKIYFSLDVIPKEEINHYAEYFNDTEIKNQEGEYIMRDYSVETRANGLTDATKSIYSNIVSFDNKPIHLGSVKGKEGSQGKELFYQFGVVSGKDSYYILQAIMSKNNTAFLYDDILEIFKSFRIEK